MHTGHAAVAAVSPGLQLRFADGVPVLCLPEEAAFPSQDFEVLRAWVRERLPEHLGVIQGRTVRLDLGRRDIKLFDLRRLVHLVKQDFSLDVTGLYLRPAAVHKFAERELKLKLFVEDATQPAFSDDQDTEEAMASAKAAPVDVLLAAATLPHDLLPEDIAPAVVGAAPPTPEPATDAEPVAVRSGSDERKVQSVHRTLRSGATVRFDGDLFIFGDVNPGAQVIATGNITVLGALKGMAHAGAGGAEDAFIFAFDLRPTQLRIGRKIAVPSETRTTPELRPEMATVVDERISIDPYGPGKAPPAPSSSRLRFWS